jgi:hypothetical protein
VPTPERTSVLMTTASPPKASTSVSPSLRRGTVVSPPQHGIAPVGTTTHRDKRPSTSVRGEVVLPPCEKTVCARRCTEYSAPPTCSGSGTSGGISKSDVPIATQTRAVTAEWPSTWIR